MVIPNAGDIRDQLKGDSGTPKESSLKKIFRANLIINILVIINLLFAITHQFYS